MGIGCYEEKEYSKKLLEIENTMAEAELNFLESRAKTADKKIGEPVQEVHYLNNGKMRERAEKMEVRKQQQNHLNIFFRTHEHTFIVLKDPLNFQHVDQNACTARHY